MEEDCLRLHESKSFADTLHKINAAAAGDGIGLGSRHSGTYYRPMLPISSSICMKNPPTLGRFLDAYSATSEDGIMGYPEYTVTKGINPFGTDGRSYPSPFALVLVHCYYYF